MKRPLILVALVISLALLSACASGDYAPDLYGQSADAEATLNASRAALRATEQALQEQAQQATIAAAQTEGAVQAQIDLLNAQATATQHAFVIAIAQAEATQRAGEVFATQTAIAQASIATATTQFEQTATAYPPIATATAVVLEQLNRQAERERLRTRLDKVWLPLRMFGPIVLLIAFLVWLAVAGQKLYPNVRGILDAFELRLRTYFYDGEIATVVPRDKELNVLLPKRSYGPAMTSGWEGVQQTGAASDPQVQNAVTARHQAALLARSLPPNGRRALQSLTSGTEDSQNGYRVLRPDEPLPGLFATQQSLPVLDAEWRNVNDDDPR